MASIRVAIRNFFEDEYADKLCGFLKHLHPQPNWKPSEEQMKALKRAADNANADDAMLLLYLSKELKKLKED